MSNKQSGKGAIAGRPLTDEERYFYKLSFKEPVESIARIEEMARFLAGAATAVAGMFLAAFRLALAGQAAEGAIWYAPVLLWGASILALVAVLYPRCYDTAKKEPAAWQAAYIQVRRVKYRRLVVGAVLLVGGLIAAVVPLVNG
jgi:hypothetical protein